MSGVCGRWYPVILELHRFFTAISRAVVNHDDCEGTAPDPSYGLLVLFPRGVGWFMLCATTLCCLAPPVTWASDWVSLPPSVITAEDVGAWPYSVGVLVKWVTFLATLHWPAAGADMGLVEFPILRCFSCMSLGLARGLSWRKLFLSIGDQVAQFQLSAVPFGPDIHIWRSCRSFC